MPITDSERKQIEKEAEFLTNYGYVKSEEVYSIIYSLNNICIYITYPPNSEESDIYIQFIEENQFFSVGWIALVRGGIKGTNEKFIHVKTLLRYIEQNYFKVIDYQFCQESNDLIDKYVRENHEKFERAIQSFLNDN